MPATAAGPRAAPAIATAILIPQDRIIRAPLGPWAARLSGQLDDTLRSTRLTQQAAAQLGFVGNNAGLIAAHRGDMDVAWRLTQRQLWWQGRLARRSGDASITAHGVQPWVNLGRLEALTGRWREALARFSGLSTYAMADTLQLGCVRLNGHAWTSLMSSREHFVRFLETVYVTDSLKAMLLNRRFEMVPPFAARFGEGGVRWICEEAAVVAECREGDPRAAAARAQAAARQAQGWTRAVLRMRAAEAHACAGDTELAAGILSPVARVVRQVSPAQMANPHLMPATARLAGACSEAGLDEDANALAQRVVEGARSSGDELMEIEMLRLLAAIAPDEEREAWAQALRGAEESTEYARYRRGGPPPPNPAVTALYDRLEDIFSN
jgi:hypothetical protein